MTNNEFQQQLLKISNDLVSFSCASEIFNAERLHLFNFSIDGLLNNSQKNLTQMERQQDTERRNVKVFRPIILENNQERGQDANKIINKSLCSKVEAEKTQWNCKIEEEKSLKSESSLTTQPEREVEFEKFSKPNCITTLQHESEYGRTVFIKFSRQDQGFLTFYPSTTAQNEIRKAEIEEMMAVFEKNGLVTKRVTIKSSDVKNFPKMLGDYFANFLFKKYNISSVKKLFKDKSSCAKLSEYLSGTNKIEDIGVETLIRLFLEFIKELDVEDIEKSRIGNNTLRVCYKMMLSYLKSAVYALREWELEEKITSIHLEKFWPTLELCVKCKI